MKHLSSSLIALVAVACSTTPDVSSSVVTEPRPAAPALAYPTYPDVEPGVCPDCCGAHEGLLCASMEEGAGDPQASQAQAPAEAEPADSGTGMRSVHVKGSRYHLIDCRRLKGNEAAVAVSEVPSGTKPCLFCKPHRQ